MPRFYEIGAIASVRGLYQYQADMRRIQASTETTMNRITNSMRRVNQNAFTGIGNSIANVSNQLRFIGAQIAQIGYSWSFLFSLPIAAGFVAATRAGMEFEASLQRIADLGGLGEEFAAEWGLAVRDLASGLGALPTEALDALYPVASVGLRELPKYVEDADGAIRGLNDTTNLWLLTLKAAAVGLGDYEEIAITAAALNRNYGESIGGVDEIFAKLFVSVREAGGEVEDFAGSIGRVLSPVRILGGDLDDILAFLSVYTKAGVPASVAVTSLRASVVALLDPSARALKAINKYGDGLSDLKKVIEEEGLIVALKSLYDTIGVDDFVTIFPSRALSGLLESLNAEDILEDIQEIENASEELEEAFENVTSTGQFQFNRLKSAIQGLGIDLYYGIRGPLGEVLSDLTDRVEAFADAIRNNPLFTKLLVQFALIVAAVGPATVALGVFMRTLGTLGLAASIPLRVIGSLISSFVRLGGTVISILGRTVIPVFRGLYLVILGTMRPLGRSLLLVGRLAFSAAKGFVFLAGVLINSIRWLGAFRFAMQGVVTVTSLSAAAFRALGLALSSFSFLSSLGILFSQITVTIAGLGGAIAGVATAIGGVLVTALGSFTVLAAPIAAVGGAVSGLIIAISKAGDVVRSKFTVIKDAVTSEAASIGPELKSHGRNIIQQFGQGMLQGVGAVVDALTYIASIIRYWLAPGSPPRILPDIDDWGRDTAKAWMEGWTTFDYSAITDIVSKFQEYLMSFAETDQQELDALYQVQEFSQVIQDAIDQINDAGGLTADIWANVEAAISGASAAMTEYVALTLQVADALEEVESIQDAIDAATEAYEASIAPLNDRLDEINAIQQGARDENRLAYLQSILENPRIPQEIKELAQLEIEEIQIQQQLDQAESEYQDIVDPLEDQLAAAEENLAMLEEQLALAQAQLDLEIEQNNLLQRIADTLDRMESAAGAAGANRLPTGEGLGESFDPEIPELPPLGGEGLGDIFNLDEATQEIDGQIKEIKRKMRDLQREWSKIWRRIRFRTSEAVDGIIEKWDEIKNHELYIFLTGALDTALKDTVKNFDAVRDSIEGVEGKMAALAVIGAIIKGNFVLISSFIANLVANFGYVWGTFLNNLDSLFNSESIGAFFVNLQKTVVDLLVRSALAIAAAGLTAIRDSLVSIASSLSPEGTPEWLQNIIDFLTLTSFNIENWGLADPENFVERIRGWFSEVWENLKTAIGEFDLGALIDTWFGNALGDGGGGGGGGGGPLGAIGSAFVNLNTLINVTVPLINEKVQSFFDKVDEVRGNIQSALYQLVIEWVKFKYKTRARIQEVIDKVEEFWDETKEKGDNIIDKLGEIWEQGVKVLKEKFDEWLDPVFTKLDDFKLKAEEVWDGMQVAINNAITAVDGAINNFFTWLSNVASALGELWTIVSTFLQNLGRGSSNTAEINTNSTEVIEVDDGSLDLNVNGPDDRSGNRYSPAAQVSQLIDALNPLVTQIEHLVIALEHKVVSDKLLMAYHSGVNQTPAEVTIGPNYINGEMDMVMFEARVRKTIGKMAS